MQEQREISRRELREWYETRTLKETMEHFGLNHEQQLYRLLDRAEIPRKALKPIVTLVD